MGTQMREFAGSSTTWTAFEASAFFAKGGNSEIYKVRSGLSGATHALKLFKLGDHDGSRRSRFTEEIEIVKKLKCIAGCSRYIDHGHDGGEPFYVVLRCLVWVETTSGGRTKVELSSDEIDNGGEISNGAIAASLCLGSLYEAVKSLDETIGDLAMEPA